MSDNQLLYQPQAPSNALLPDPAKLGSGPETSLEQALRVGLFDIAPGQQLLDAAKLYQALQSGDNKGAAGLVAQLGLAALPMVMGMKAPMGKIPFEKMPQIGWWRSGPTVDLYHGTHVNNLDSILQNGVTVKDPKTGMVSMTLDPHTANGYAAMSGEGAFRAAGAKAKATPQGERAVVKYTVPMEWVEQNLDPRLGGNLGDMGKRIADPKEYEAWLAKHGPDKDAEYYGTSELRLSKEVPPEFLAGYMRKP